MYHLFCLQLKAWPDTYLYMFFYLMRTSLSRLPLLIPNERAPFQSAAVSDYHANVGLFSPH